MRSIRAAIALAVVVAATVAPNATRPASAENAPSDIQSFRAPFTSVGASVVDPATGTSYVSSPHDNAVYSFSSSGRLLHEAWGQYGADGMALVNDHLYVVASTLGAITELDPTTLEQRRIVATGLVQHPELLAGAGGFLWTTVQPQDAGRRIKPSTAATVAVPLPAYTAGLRTVPTNTNRLLSYSDTTPAHVTLWNVTNGATQQLATATSDFLSAFTDVAIGPNGSTMYPAAEGRDALVEHSMNTLRPTGVEYPTAGTPMAVASTAAGGGLLAAADQSGTVSVYRAGIPEAIATRTVPGRVAVPGTLTFTPDGTKLLAVTGTLDTSGCCLPKVAGPYYLDIISAAPQPRLGPATYPHQNPQGNWVGTYGADGYLIGGWNTPVGPPTPGTPTDDLASLPPGATATITTANRVAWTAPAADPAALQDPTATTRRATAWTDPTAVTVTITFADGYTGDVHLYSLDRDTQNRRQRLTLNAHTGTNDTITVTNFAQGAWTDANLRIPPGGQLTITATTLTPAPAVLTAILLGDTATDTATASPSVTTMSSDAPVATADVGPSALPVSSVADAVIDPVLGRYFIVDPVGSSIVVTRATGAVIKTIGSESGVVGMAIIDRTLFVAHSNGTIDRINLDNLKPRSAVATSLGSPMRELTVASGKLWTVAYQNNNYRIVGVDPSDGTTTSTLYGYCCPDLSSPATSGGPDGFIYVWVSGSGGAVTEYDVSSGTAVLGRTTSNTVSEYMLDSTFSPTGDAIELAGMFPDDRVEHIALSSMNYTGVEYPTAGTPMAVASTAAGGGLLAAADQSGTVSVYRAGIPEAIATRTVPGRVAVPGTLTFTPDGTKLLAVTGTLDTSGCCLPKVAGPYYLDIISAAPQPRLGPATYPHQNPQGNWVGTYGADGYLIGGWNTPVGPPTPGAPTDDLASLPPGATATITTANRVAWTAPAADPAALQDPTATTRRATAWTDPTAVTVTITFADGYTGDVHLYSLDRDTQNRRQRLTLNAHTGTNDTITVTNFAQGAWTDANLRIPPGGQLTITATTLTPAPAVLTAILLGDTPAA